MNNYHRCVHCQPATVRQAHGIAAVCQLVNRKKSTLLLFICILLLPAFSNGQWNWTEVKTSYSEITIPTYEWRGKDDLNPSFRWTSAPMYSPHTTTYPYATQDNLSRTKKEVTYKTMVVENDYLKVVVIPELGGHVHSVIDKLTGKSIVYDNKVVKPSLIGLRGAWTAGGIEFNTGPQGHTVTCLSPVEAKFVEFEDGSKGIAIGNVEQVYHTQWVATIRLYPSKDYMEESIRIYNPGENKRLYYFWNCVAVENTDSLQLIYPMSLGQDHWGKTFYKWPVDKGIDQSWMKNFQLPTSIFSYRCDQNFYGSYDHALDRGLITFANHFELEGKKSWTWGHGTWGARFQACLRDDSSAYNEIQTGPLPTQADYGILQPHQTVNWKEWWYPVRGTKGVAFSNKDVTLNIFKDEKKKSLSLLINATAKYDATVIIDPVSGETGEQAISLSPEKAAIATFSTKALKDTFHIVIMTHTSILADFIYPIPIPLRTPPDNPRELPSDKTASGCWLRGVQCVKEGGNQLGRDWFGKALAMDENFTPAMTALAEQLINSCQYDSTITLLKKCVKLTPDDGWAMYYLAQAYMETGNTAEALDMAYHAARCAESASPSYSLAGTILMRQGKFSEAVDPLKEALKYNAHDLASRDLLAYSLYKGGAADQAAKELKAVQDIDPLDMPSGVMLKMMGKGDKEFSGRVAGKMEEVLDMADFFLAAGLKNEAITVLKEYYLDIDKKEPAPLIYYYYGILANDSKVLAQGMEMSPDYVFPNSRPAERILREAIKINPKDWKARFYLGNFLFEHSLKDEAVAQWKEALKLHDNYSVLNRNLGLVAWKVDNNAWQAIGYYEKAVRCNPEDIAIQSDLASLYIDNTRQYAKAKALLEKLVVDKKCRRADIVSMLARTYNILGEYDKSLALLTGDSYMNWEGRGSLYSIYTESRLGKGEQLYNQQKYEEALKEFKASMDYPMTLGPGLTTDPETARSLYWIGLTMDKMGRKEDAVKQWKQAAEQITKGSDENKKYASEAKEMLGN